MSESSRARSSASTWMLTRNVDCAVGAHSTSSSRSGWRWRLGGVGAVAAVHRDAAALGDEAEDRVGRHRRAALGELDPDVGRALDDDAGVAGAGRLRRGARRSVMRDALGEVLRRAVLAAVQLDHPAYDGLGAEVALPDRRVERRDVGQPEVRARPAVSDSWESTRLSGRPSLRISLAICSLPRSIASSRRSLVNHCRILVRARGDLTKLSQSRDGAGVRRLGGEDLDHVAVVERRLQRHQPAVDPGADRVVADLGVDGVGEVDRRRTRPAARSRRRAG